MCQDGGCGGSAHIKAVSGSTHLSRQWGCGDACQGSVCSGSVRGNGTHQGGGCGDNRCCGGGFDGSGVDMWQRCVWQHVPVKAPPACVGWGAKPREQGQPQRKGLGGSTSLLHPWYGRGGVGRGRCVNQGAGAGTAMAVELGELGAQREGVQAEQGA